MVMLAALDPALLRSLNRRKRGDDKPAGKVCMVMAVRGILSASNRLDLSAEVQPAWNGLQLQGGAGMMPAYKSYFKRG